MLFRRLCKCKFSVAVVFYENDTAGDFSVTLWLVCQFECILGPRARRVVTLAVGKQFPKVGEYGPGY